MSERKMTLTFRTNFGYRFELDVSRDDTLEEIKVKINSVYGFLIPSQTLSFNGKIIASDADLRAAPLIDGSVIRLDIADDAPPTEPTSPVVSAQTTHRDKRVRLNSGSSSSSTAAESDDSPKMVSITLKLPAPYDAVYRETTDDETILELKKLIHKTKGIPIDLILIKDQSGEDLLDDAMTLLQCQIPDKSELDVEIQIPTVISLVSFKVVLQYGNERETVVVDATDKVRQLRTMIEGNQVSTFNDILPDPYLFIHKQDSLDENLTFLEQNVAEGAVIEFFSGHLAVYMNLKLETNIPRKPFINVRIHSNDTIQDLKEKIRMMEGISVHRILIRRNGVVQPDHEQLHACSITSDYGVTVEILNQ